MKDTPISPAAMLATIIKNKEKASGIWLISGERQVGKTTWCASLAHQAKSAGLIAGGLISPAVFSGSEKIGFDLIDLQSSEQRHFGTTDDRRADWIKLGIWYIDPNVIAWANERLQCCQSCDLLILDELGPLEFFENQGFQEGMRLLDKHIVPFTFVVIRPELMPIAQNRWRVAGVIEIARG